MKTKACALCVGLGAGLGLALAAGAACAVDLPLRRGGLWESQITGGPMNAMAMTIRSCVDPAQERADSPFSGGRKAPGCAAAPQVSPAPGGGWAYHQVCRPGGRMTMDVSGVATGDFRSGYVIHTITRMTPAPVPSMAESRMTITARWLGACPAGMKPGDATVNGRGMPTVRHAPH